MDHSRRPSILRVSGSKESQSDAQLRHADARSLDVHLFVGGSLRFQGTARYPTRWSRFRPIANGDVSKDGLTLKYKLRKNMKWQDGPPLTCNDLRFTWQAVINPHNNVITTDGYKSICEASTVRIPIVAIIHMKKLYAPYLQQLWGVNGNAPILPEHILAKYNDDKGSFNTAPFNALPVGSGPFKVVAWNRGQDVRMVANPNFYLGKPKLNEVIYKIPAGREYGADPDSDARAGHGGARLPGMKWPDYAALAADPKMV